MIFSNEHQNPKPSNTKKPHPCNIIILLVLTNLIIERKIQTQNWVLKTFGQELEMASSHASGSDKRKSRCLNVFFWLLYIIYWYRFVRASNQPATIYLIRQTSGNASKRVWHAKYVLMALKKSFEQHTVCACIEISFKITAIDITSKTIRKG